MGIHIFRQLQPQRAETRSVHQTDDEAAAVVKYGNDDYDGGLYRVIIYKQSTLCVNVICYMESKYFLLTVRFGFKIS